MQRLGFLTGCLLFHAIVCHAQDKAITLSTITNATEPSSADVMKSFRQKIGAHPKLFTLVDFGTTS